MIYVNQNTDNKTTADRLFEKEKLYKLSWLIAEELFGVPNVYSHPQSSYGESCGSI